MWQTIQSSKLSEEGDKSNKLLFYFFCNHAVNSHSENESLDSKQKDQHTAMPSFRCHYIEC